MKLPISLLIVTTILALNACTFQHNKVTTGEDGFGKAPLCEPISFSQVQAEIFGTPQSSTGKCLACHVAGGPLLALDTYSSVKARLAQIEDSVRSNRMPKNAVLPAATKQLLFAWIQQGAPELADASAVAANCNSTANPDPTVPVDPSVPTDPTAPPSTPGLIEPHYDSLKKEIFASQCLDCHDSSGIWSVYDFSTYEALISYPKLFALPADGTDSRFVNSLVTGRMPRGKAPLSADKIEIIRQWVALGLPKTAANIGDGIGDGPVNGGDNNDPQDDDDDGTAPDPAPAPAPVSPPTRPPVADCDQVDFNTVNTLVFQTSCTRCHDFTSKVNLESYSNIKQHLSSVQWMIQTDKMPPKKPLSPELKTLVLKWIDQGAPETVSLPQTCNTKGEAP